MPNIAELNALSQEEFTRVVGPVFEHSPWVAERSYGQRPFATREELYLTMCNALRRATDEEKLALIRAHPDLVGRAVLTSESKVEQASAGLGELTPVEVTLFETYNAEYRRRFGFPFVICARLNKKEAILRAFPERLRHSRDTEMQTALNEIYKIAELRLRDLVP